MLNRTHRLAGQTVTLRAPQGEEMPNVLVKDYTGNIEPLAPDLEQTEEILGASLVTIEIEGQQHYTIDEYLVPYFGDQEGGE